MLSKKAKYAMQACLVLAKLPSGSQMMIAEIAQAEGIPKKFLEIILLELRNGGLLQSRKGKGGGYLLAKPAKLITMGQIIRLIEGPIALVPCVSQMAYQPCAECVSERLCGVRMVMKDVRDATAEILDGASLQDVVDRIHREIQLVDSPSDYVI